MYYKYIRTADAITSSITNCQLVSSPGLIPPGLVDTKYFVQHRAPPCLICEFAFAKEAQMRPPTPSCGLRFIFVSFWTDVLLAIYTGQFVLGGIRPSRLKVPAPHNTNQEQLTTLTPPYLFQPLQLIGRVRSCPSMNSEGNNQQPHPIAPRVGNLWQVPPLSLTHTLSLSLMILDDSSASLQSIVTLPVQMYWKRGPRGPQGQFARPRSPNKPSSTHWASFPLNTYLPVTNVQHVSKHRRLVSLRSVHFVRLRASTTNQAAKGDLLVIGINGLVVEEFYTFCPPFEMIVQRCLAIWPISISELQAVGHRTSDYIYSDRLSYLARNGAGQQPQLGQLRLPVGSPSKVGKTGCQLIVPSHPAKTAPVKSNFSPVSSATDQPSWMYQPSFLSGHANFLSMILARWLRLAFPCKLRAGRLLLPTPRQQLTLATAATDTPQPLGTSCPRQLQSSLPQSSNISDKSAMTLGFHHNDAEQQSSFQWGCGGYPASSCEHIPAHFTAEYLNEEEQLSSRI
ncbi:hypothetical protein SODALDRAFT_356033 [Sodiomyces alkalinus F11]|uniref:Uncharacterized protein n=1 Tax=Sodiomyces alkalinus (strain CBS 110278 / VKM F-3762 / F11) TaxID=1314773 RepID=A0A3N2QAR7_SODAK|nr:hypothetical protein SODALDRAFT_356033 [Sodiomyces alkalinus F11]ROT43807.1 hypothetical protein SODALDRAFT_356033 [Sodiomyces alkalinus F11]